MKQKKKEGTVLLLGRPNVGKSTFVNNLIGQKVAITSPKPQTTRFPINALYEDKRGRLVFVDTPGIFGKAEDTLARKINTTTYHTLEDEIDVVIYMIDPTRRRDFEEGRVLGIVRKIKNAYKILVINKSDQDLTYLPQYRFLQDEVDATFAVSALTRQHVEPLLVDIFAHIGEKKDDRKEDENEPVYPILNMDSSLFVAELIREKIFLHTGREVPYSCTVVVEEIAERENGTKYIKAQILTTHDRYKKMIIGKEGAKIKDLGRIARKEIELAINKKVYLDLHVSTDAHWHERLYG